MLDEGWNLGHQLKPDSLIGICYLINNFHSGIQIYKMNECERVIIWNPRMKMSIQYSNLSSNDWNQNEKC